MFAYAGVELIGTTSGEAQNPKKVIPKAINTVVVRILVFYVGSVLLLSLLLPYSAYQAGVSPFVTFFGSIGFEGADAIMNMVVLTAALSSLNAGLYSTGRILHSMSMAGSAPKFAGRMNKAGVPYGGIALTAFVTLLGVGLNAVVPEEAFEIVLNVACLGILGSWATIVLCQLKLLSWAKQGSAAAPVVPDVRCPLHRLPGAGLPGRSAGAGRLRLPGRHLDRGLARRHRSAAGPRAGSSAGRGSPRSPRSAPATPGSSR